MTQAVVAKIRTQTEEEFIIEHKTNNTMIYAKSVEDRHRIMECLRSGTNEFHTYTPRENKTHAFILKGLAQGPEPRGDERTPPKRT
ncbi:hypothetical protein JTB14_000291 [Gonioctena quinquepunctata]|nr:hypothetical protein JTB14_000291 [Gonioctena quinquepunctata]